MNRTSLSSETACISNTYPLIVRGEGRRDGGRARERQREMWALRTSVTDFFNPTQRSCVTKFALDCIAHSKEESFSHRYGA